MNTRQQTRVRRSRSRGGSLPLARGTEGFVLIAVLFLVALITVLVVGSTLLARIERRATANDATTILAQQNALLALNVALGQLQREVGPDQRVTARADILDTSAGSTNIANSTLTQPFWTGVWKTYNPNVSSQKLDVGTTPLRPWSTASTNTVWLVSGYVDGATTITPATFPASGASSVTVATNVIVSGGTTTSMAVQVPLVPIALRQPSGQNVVTGHYGYWVSDEGIKAKANLVDGSLTLNGVAVGPSPTTWKANPNVSDLFRNLIHFRAPAANAAFLGLPSTLGTDNRSSTNSWAVTSLASLQYVPSTAPTSYSPNQYRADYTTYSMGVLADAKNGGLKKDLTAAFESTSNFQALFPSNGQTNWQRIANVLDTGQVFVSDYTGATVSAAGGPWYDGIRWQTLFNYYNLYKSVMPYPYTSGTASGSVPYGAFSQNWSGATPQVLNPAQLPYGIQQRFQSLTEGSSATTFNTDWITPVVLATKFTVVLGATLINSGPNAGKYNLELRWFPELVAWNPYSTRIFGKYVSAGSFNSLILRTWNALQFTTSGTGIKISVNGAIVPVPYLSDPVNFDVSPQPLLVGYPPIATSAQQTGTMEPGEVRIFTLPGPGTVTNPQPAGGWLYSGASGATAATKAGSFTTLAGNDPPSTADSPYNFNYVVCNPSGKYYNGTDLVTVQGPSGVGSAGNAFHTYVNGISTYPGSGGTAGADTALPTRPSFTGLGAASALKTTGVTMASLAGSPPAGYLLVSEFIRTKGIQPTTNTNFYNYDSNVPVFLPNCPTFNPADDTYSGQNQEQENAVFVPFNSATLATPYISIGPTPTPSNFTPSGFTDTTWGTLAVGDTSALTTPPVTTESQVIIREIPTEPLVSLGQFTHMPCTYFGSSSSYAHMPMGLMLVGGSTPNPGIPLNQTYTLGSNGVAFSANGMNDDSFMVNQGLFDGCFFSTVPAASNQYTSLFSGGVSPFTGFNQAYVTSNDPLPNARLRYYSPSGGAPTVADLQDPRKAAANLMLDGAFNVNSTSVAAWTALLGSLSGNGLALWNAYFKDNAANTTGGVTKNYTSAALNYSIPRFLTASVTPGASAGTVAPGTGPWDGTHPMTSQQITELATEIVRQVKYRGPFLSMADFLNRRLNPTSTLASVTDPYQQAEGALQAAIDAQTESTYSAYSDGINTTANTYGTTVSISAALTSAAVPAPIITANLPKHTAIGIPAYLMQQDIIQAFAPVMTVRSDTFVIRCYGEADNPATGAVQSQAWGEAVVQRVPDYMDQTDPALTTAQSTAVPPIAYACGNATPPYNYNGTALVNATNQTLGRRFKIISFHWLNQNES